MPYHSITDLPESVQNSLSKHAQDIYKDAFNSAWDEYKDSSERQDSREATAHRVAWGAVKAKYEKDDTGKWRAM